MEKTPRAHVCQAPWGPALTSLGSRFPNSAGRSHPDSKASPEVWVALRIKDVRANRSLLQTSLMVPRHTEDEEQLTGLRKRDRALGSPRPGVPAWLRPVAAT